MFPQGKQLGGAPANFAYMTAMLGDDGVVASRVGGDRLGHEALWQLKSSGLDTAHIQSDPLHDTGTVLVQVDAKGQPEYRITENVAWDFLEFSKPWRALAETADAVCFGSLAQRSEVSHNAISSFLKKVRPEAARVFDVNLRQLFYSTEILRTSATLADIIKLNHEELPLFTRLFGKTFSNELAAARWILDEFSMKLVCVTKGAQGSVLISPGSAQEHAGFAVKIADTVGAGDAFTAALVHHWLRGSSLHVMNESANRMGAWVASQEGAMPAPDESVLENVRVKIS